MRVRLLAVALALGGCDRGKTGEAPVEAPAVAGSHDDAAAGGEAEAQAAADGGAAAVPGASGGGLAATVKQEVEAARERDAAPNAAPPVVPAGSALVAVVGGVPVPRSAFDEVYTLKAKKYADRGRTIPSSAEQRYRKSIVERLVYHEQLRQRVVELGSDFDPAALAARAEEPRREITDWAAHLERRGETEATLRAMLVAELREEVILERTGELSVSRAEIEKEYEAVKANWDSLHPRIRASHILVPVAEAGPGDDPAALVAAAKAEAARIHALVTAPGAEFAALAREHSTGPSASKGGDIGIFTRERMAEEFSKVAFAMKTGEISKPVKTKFGFHIIHVTGKWPPGVLPIDALEDDIVERLRQRKLHAGRRALKEALAEAYPVTHHLLTPEEQRPKRPSRPGSPSVVVEAEPEPEQE